MEISRDTLMVELEDDFDNYEIRPADQEDTILVVENIYPYQYRKSREEYFKNTLKEFLYFHTKEWDIVSVSGNRIEGRLSAVIGRIET